MPTMTKDVRLPAGHHGAAPSSAGNLQDAKSEYRTTPRTSLKKRTRQRRSARNALTLLQADGMRLVLIALHEGAEMKTHTAPGIISVQLLEGHLGFEAEGQTTKLKPGKLLTLQTGLPHRVVARRESVFLLTMANPAAERPEASL